MTATDDDDDDDDASATIMADILKVCKNGCTKEKIIDEMHLSHDQLRGDYSRDGRQRVLAIY
jgi:hypothetical protein